MTFEEYRDLYLQVLQLDQDFEPVTLPIEVEEGETQTEALLRFLVEQDFIELDNDVCRIPDRGRIEEFNPSLLKLLDAVIMASAHAELDALQDEGFVYMTADSDGNICYELTEIGRQEFGA